MEVKEIIESGTLELYVMGVLSAEETRQIDNLRTAHPQVEEEIQRIERDFEAFAKAQAVVPANQLKEEIAGKLKFGIGLDLDQDKVSAIIVELTPLMKVAAAAAIAAIIVLTGVVIYFSGRLTVANNQVAKLQEEKEVLIYQNEALNKESLGLNKQLSVLTDAATKPVLLTGQAASPQSRAVVFWNASNGAVCVNAAALPAIPAEKQFQLWAIVNGKPVDLGVLDKNSSLLMMKTVTNAQAFAITLEPLNGSPQPTLNQMYVLGNV